MSDFLATSDRDAPSTLASVVYERLREDVLSAALLPGDKLRLQFLCNRYEAGTSPVREALNRLATEGLVTQQDQKGFRVSPVSFDELRDLTKARCLINELALRESIRTGDAAWEERILLSFHRLVRATPPADMPLSREAERCHRAFHDALIAACGSQRILGFARQLFEQARRYQHLSVSPVATPRNGNEEHRLIMLATLDRNAEEAVRLLSDHFNKTVEIVVALNALAPTAATGARRSARRTTNAAVMVPTITS